MSTTSPSPYTDRRFWRAYATLYWPRLKENPQLRDFVEQVCCSLPDRPAGQPLRVLALGFGFGGIELPLIYHLKEILKTQLEIVVIDNAAEPLAFAASLLKRGISALPQTPELLLPMFDQFPESGSIKRERYSGQMTLPGGDVFTSILDDLEWESLDWEHPDPDTPPLCPRLSRWHERLVSDLGTEYRFDLVIAAFSLFHIGFWRCPLFHSLNLLKAGGLFFHACVEGDEEIFEGRQGSQKASNAMASRIFCDTVFKHPRAQRILEERRGASASRPYVIAEFLDRLESFGVVPLLSPDNQNQFRYTLNPTVPATTYADLLETRGFSTFRNIENRKDENDVGGADDYRTILENVKSLVAEGGSDRLEIEVAWSIHRVEPETLHRFPLYSRFTGGADNPGSDSVARALAEAYRTEYEINCAISINPHGSDEQQLAEMGKKINQQGAMNDFCLAVQFGAIHKGATRPEFYFMSNLLRTDPLVSDRQAAEIAWYLALLEQRRTYKPDADYSNTQTLLDVAISLFGSRPCIFTYQMDALDFDIEHKTARDYEEIRFLVPGPKPEFLKRLAFLKERWMLAIRRSMRSDFKDQHLDKGKLVFSLADFNALTDHNTKTVLAESFELFWAERDLTQIRDKLRRRLSTFRSLSSEAVRNFGDTITEVMVYRSVCLQLLSDCRFIAFYPASYEVRGLPGARELVIAMYSSVPSEALIKTELHKYNQVFEQIRSKSQEAAAGSKTTAEIVHRLPSTLGAIRNALLAQTPPPKIPVLFNSLYLFSSLAKMREGFIPEAPTWGEIEAQFDSSPSLLLVGSQLEQLWRDIALPIARSRLRQSTSSMGRNPPSLDLQAEGNGFPLTSREEARVVIGALLVMMIEAIQHSWPTDDQQTAIVSVCIKETSVALQNPSNGFTIRTTQHRNQHQELLALGDWLKRLAKMHPCTVVPAAPTNSDSTLWRASLCRRQIQ